MTYVGLIVGASKGDMLNLAALGGVFGSEKVGKSNFKILDTSVIIDGRIADIAETGFLDGIIVIPQFVLRELQLVADSADSMKRNRGRRGLDILQRIQKMPDLNVQILEDDFPHVRDVDMKLIELAKAYGCKIVTNDFNLNKVAQLHGVDVLNINELANALKPIVLPGETMRVFILKEGKEYNQGVAYLDDGTMVVVDNAKKVISKTIDISVTSVLADHGGQDDLRPLRRDGYTPFTRRLTPRNRRTGRRGKAAPATCPRQVAGDRSGAAGPDGRQDESRRDTCPRRAWGRAWARQPRRRAGTSRKQFMLLDGSPILLHTIRKFVSCPSVTEIVVALRKEDLPGSKRCWPASARPSRSGWWRAGTARQQSVENALESAGVLTSTWWRCTTRCGRSSSPAVIERAIREAAESGAAIVGIVPVDTVKQVHRNKIHGTIPRDRLVLAQTPQVFRHELLAARLRQGPRGRLHRDGRIQPGGAAGTGGGERGAGQRPQHQDHQALRHGPGAALSGGRSRPRRERRERAAAPASAGTYTVSRPGRPLILGGVKIPSELGLAGHSDADVLAHAITDALLGAAALGDIGLHFPDTDPRWTGADSLQFLRHACDLVAAAGYEVVNVDSTVILERPKLKDYRPAIREKLAETLEPATRPRVREVQDSREARPGGRGLGRAGAGGRNDPDDTLVACGAWPVVIGQATCTSHDPQRPGRPGPYLSALFSRAARNSSPGFQVGSRSRFAALWPSRKPRSRDLLHAGHVPVVAVLVRGLVIVLGVVLLEHLFPVTFRLARELVAFVHREGGDAGLREREVVRAVEAALLGSWVGPDGEIHALGGVLDLRPEGGPLGSGDHHILGAPERERKRRS